jgi:predicted HTH domain antitoxin
MPTEALTLTVPASLAQELGSASQDFLVEILERGLREFKIERALERYAQGDISFGAAARLAEVSQPDLARHAYARGMEPPFSPKTPAEELG